MNAEADSPQRAPDASISIWTFGDAELDERRHELRVAGHAVALESKPYALLRVLLQRAGETLAKEELIDAVWPGRVVTDGVLAKCVAKLRSALADADQKLIRTVHGYGYRLAAAVDARTTGSTTSQWVPRAGDALAARANWKFTHELGHGGFGCVWLAEHAKTHEKRVFKFAVDGAGLHALKREITLYRLLHESLGEGAGIVRIIDWNIDEPPYFVESEYIAGGDLVQWCESRGGAGQVDKDVRLEIIARIADALAAAHSVGVLHKDLKPANVLVDDANEGMPEIRLVDFGSGRALEPDRLAALGITRLGMTQTQAHGESTSGTPLYLAPELIAGGAATVRADIYALGVMLYQFLVGDFRRPLAPGWERDIAPHAIPGCNAVADELLREDIAAAADLDPAQRLGDVADLARRLRSLGQRVEKRESERTAAVLVARQREQISRWRVHRRWLLILCAVFALAAGALTSLYLREQRESAIAKTVNAFLNDDLLAAANPYSSRHSNLRVREVLDRARVTIRRRFAGHPAEEAAVRTALGRSYLGIGEHALARQQLQRALVLSVELRGKRSDDSLTLRRLLADNDVEDSRYANAAAAYAKLAADVAATFGPRSPKSLDLDAARAHLALKQGHVEAAARQFETIIPQLRVRIGADADVTLRATSDLGQAYRTMAKFNEAETGFKAVYQACLKRFGKTHWRTLQSLQDLAQLERARGDLHQAVTIEREVVTGREKIFGRDHDETQNALNELAGMLQDQQHYAVAEPLFREVLATRLRTLGERHERTRNSMNNLALLLSLEGKLDESEKLFKRVLGIEQSMLGADNLDVMILRHNLAGLERRRGDYQQAESLERAVLASAAKTLAPQRPENGLFMAGLGLTLQKEKRYREAAGILASAHKNLLAAYGPNHPRVLKLERMQLAVYREWGRPMPATK